MYSRYVSGILLRRYNSSSIAPENIRNVSFFNQHYGKMHGRLKWCGRKMSLWLREQSVQVVNACTKQFEFIAAQRIRRSIQIFHLYTRIWDEIALKEFMRSWRRRMAKNTKDFLVGSVGFTVFNWEQEKIPDKEMYSYSEEIEGIYKLKDSTVVCQKCCLRLVIDAKQPGVKYCQCPKNKANKQDEMDWEPFIERQDMLVWRREEKDFRGLYSYKVYGSFDDVSAEDFLQVQIDVDYRKKWDATAKQLEVIDTDPLSKESVESCSDVIYWEMVWPRMFTNRDYVYQRRWLHDKNTGVVIIVSKGTDHPNAPNRPDTYRVTTYWSYMVIKPYTNFHEPGIEFGLTYFDDPGVNIPSAVTSWVAMSGLPDYLCRMRQASKDYKTYKALQEAENSTVKSLITLHSESNEDSASNINNSQQDKATDQDSSIISHNIVSATNEDDSESSQIIEPESNESELDESELNESEFDESEDENEEKEDNELDDQGFLDYFFLAKLFA